MMPDIIETICCPEKECLCTKISYSNSVSITIGVDIIHVFYFSWMPDYITGYQVAGRRPPTVDIATYPIKPMFVTILPKP